MSKRQTESGSVELAASLIADARSGTVIEYETALFLRDKLIKAGLTATEAVILGDLLKMGAES